MTVSSALSTPPAEDDKKLIMKKKLVLHIGYPKTASTTLQEVLTFLCQKNKVKYLGKNNQASPRMDPLIEDMISEIASGNLDKTNYARGIDAIQSNLGASGGGFII